MALLGNDFDRNDPTGSQTPALGDNSIRDIKARVQDWANAEHDGGTGYHKLYRGSNLATIPTPIAGQIAIQAGTYDELYGYSGTAWNKLTTNQTVADNATNLTTHINYNDSTTGLNHPDASVTTQKIKASAIVTKHVMGGTSTASIADVFNGSANGNNYHTHSTGAAADGSITRAKLANTSPGDYIVYTWGGHNVAVGVSYVKYNEVMVGQAGGIRVYFSLTGNYSNTTIYGKVYKNGTSVGAEHTHTGTGSATYSDDISSVLSGDLIQIYCYAFAQTGVVSAMQIGVVSPMIMGGLINY